ncbi:hypothetical protein QYE76_064086, partial [Lolium multiflorum]
PPPRSSSAVSEPAGRSPEFERRRELFIQFILFLSPVSHRSKNFTAGDSDHHGNHSDVFFKSASVNVLADHGNPNLFRPSSLRPSSAGAFKGLRQEYRRDVGQPGGNCLSRTNGKEGGRSCRQEAKARSRDSEAKAGEWVVTKALIERGFSFPPSDLFTEILKAYELQPQNISPNNILAISNHVTLCEGHLRVTPELSLFQYYFSVKKETISQTSSLATCGSITFKLRLGRIYPRADRHESVRYWSGGFFYLKDVSDPTNPKVLPDFKDGPASETPAWTQCPHLSESTQLTRAVRRICRLAEDGLSGKDLTMSCFTKRIQPLQHRDSLMFQYTGRDDLMRASKDNLSADALDKRIRVLIKIPRDLRIHVCNIDIHTNGSGIALEALEEKDLRTLTRVPHVGNTDPEAASNAEAPEALAPTKRKMGASSGPASKRAREAPSAEATRKAEAEKKRLKQIDTSKQSQPNIDQFFLSSSKSFGSMPPKNPKKKTKRSPASMPITPQVEAPPRPSSSAAPNPKDVINLNDLPEEPNVESGKGASDKGESGKGASSSHPPPEEPDVTSAQATANDAKQNLLKLSGATVWGNPEKEQQDLATLEGNIKVFFAQHKNVRQNTRKLHEDMRVLVLEQKAEIEGLHKSYADSQQAITILETRVKKHEEEIANRPSIKEISAELARS